MFIIQYEWRKSIVLDSATGFEKGNKLPFINITLIMLLDFCDYLVSYLKKGIDRTEICFAVFNDYQ